MKRLLTLLLAAAMMLALVACGGGDKPAASTPVRPEVEYQEKSTAEVHPSHRPVNLEQPAQRSDHYATKDNSIDGFLAVKGQSEAKPDRAGEAHELRQQIQN